MLQGEGGGNDPSDTAGKMMAKVEAELEEVKAKIAALEDEIKLYKFPDERLEELKKKKVDDSLTSTEKGELRNLEFCIAHPEHLQRQLAALQEQLAGLQREKNLLLEEKAALRGAGVSAGIGNAAARAGDSFPYAYRVRAVVGDYRSSSRLRVFEFAAEHLAYYGVPRATVGDNTHRSASIGWVQEGGAGVGEARAEAEGNRRPFDLHVDVLFGVRDDARRFVRALESWPDSALESVEVDVGEPVRADNVDLADHEEVHRVHYQQVSDENSPSKAHDVPADARSDLAPTSSVTLDTELARCQGLDTAYMRRTAEREAKGQKCHLIPQAVCVKHYWRADDDRRVAERYPDNFVVMSGTLHGWFDAWGTDRTCPLFALRYAGTAGKRNPARVSRSLAAHRTPVNVDVIAHRAIAADVKDFIFSRLTDYEERDDTIVNGVGCSTRRIVMHPLAPERFKECMDFKFAETMTIWVAEDDGADCPKGAQRTPADFGIDTTVFKGACFPGSHALDKLRLSTRAKRRRCGGGNTIDLE